MGLNSIHDSLHQIVMEIVDAMFEEEKGKFKSLLKRCQPEIHSTELPCLIILRKKLSAVLDDEELQLLNSEETIRRSMISPMHEFEVCQGECCSTSSLVDKKNVTSTMLSLVSYLTSVHFTHSHRYPITINRREENMRRFSSSLATLTFPLFLLSTIFSHPFERPQGSHSLLLTLFSLFNFMAFVTASLVMILVRARFTLTQIIMLLISTIALNIWSSNFLIFSLLSIPALASFVLCGVCIQIKAQVRRSQILCQ